MVHISVVFLQVGNVDHLAFLDVGATIHGRQCEGVLIRSGTASCGGVLGSRGNHGGA